MDICLQLFISFCKVGVLMFGGGLAMLPVLENEIVTHRGWMSYEEMLDMYAIAQCTPGVIAVNTATKVGYKMGGLKGAVFATAGVITPSFFIILVIAKFIQNFGDNEIVKKVLSGIRVASCAMMASTIIKLLKAGTKDWVGIAVFAISFVIIFICKIPSVWLIVIAILLGLSLGRFGKEGEESK